MHKKERVSQKLSRFWRILGPGLVTGAADDDPSGIATYSQTGAQFGTKQLWTAVMMLPFMIAVQEAAARISVVTRSGLAEVIRNNYSRKVLYFAVLLMVFANIFNIGADIGAMVETVNLLISLPFFIGIVFITAVIVFLELFVPYRQYAKILKLSTFALFAYPLTLVMIHVPWGYILRQTITPHFELNFNFLFIIVGVLGTTISPYLFFWQGNQEVEEEKEAGMVDNPHFTAKIKKMLAAMRLDNAVGMIMSEFVTWSIIVVTALVLNKNGVQNINTAVQAAAALEPLVHNFLYAGFFCQVALCDRHYWQRTSRYSRACRLRIIRTFRSCKMGRGIIAKILGRPAFLRRDHCRNASRDANELPGTQSYQGTDLGRSVKWHCCSSAYLPHHQDRQQ